MATSRSRASARPVSPPHAGQPEQRDERLAVADLAPLGRRDSLAPGHPLDQQPLVLVGCEPLAVGRLADPWRGTGASARTRSRARCRSVAIFRHDPARMPVSSSSSRGAARSGSSIEPSSATSSVPAGISSSASPTATRYCRTSRTRSSSSMARIATAPGWPAISRVARVPSARSMVSIRNVR